MNQYLAIYQVRQMLQKADFGKQLMQILLTN